MRTAKEAVYGAFDDEQIRVAAVLDHLVVIETRVIHERIELGRDQQAFGETAPLGVVKRRDACRVQLVVAHRSERLRVKEAQHLWHQQEALVAELDVGGGERVAEAHRRIDEYLIGQPLAELLRHQSGNVAARAVAAHAYLRLCEIIPFFKFKSHFHEVVSSLFC